MKINVIAAILAVVVLQSGCVSHYVAKHAIRKVRETRAEVKAAKADARAARDETKVKSQDADDAPPGERP